MGGGGGFTHTTGKRHCQIVAVDVLYDAVAALRQPQVAGTDVTVPRTLSLDLSPARLLRSLHSSEHVKQGTVS
jgi:hypothetical protein